MTVKELIEELKNFNEDSVVLNGNDILSGFSKAYKYDEESVIIE